MKYRTLRLRSGAIVQAGLNVTPHSYFDRHKPKHAPYRAIVIDTYVEDSTGRDTARRRQKVLCDVVLVSSMINLQRVQVEQRLGVNNGQLWIPRPTTRQISTGDGVQLQRVSPRGTPSGEPTPFDDMDGDMVLIDFIEGDLDYPIIRGCLEHERTLRSIVEGSGWAEGENGSERGTAHKDESYQRWAGTEVRVNAAGDYLIDTVGATDDIREETVDENGGQIRLRVKSEQHFTVEMDGTDVLEVWKDGSQVRIDLGESASEALVLGDTFKSWLDGELEKINTFWTTIFNTHTHTVPMGGSSGAPSVTQADSIADMPDTTLSDLAKTKKS